MYLFIASGFAPWVKRHPNYQDRFCGSIDIEKLAEPIPDYIVSITGCISDVIPESKLYTNEFDYRVDALDEKIIDSMTDEGKLHKLMNMVIVEYIIQNRQ